MTNRAHELVRRNALKKREALRESLALLDERLSNSVMKVAGGSEVSAGIGTALSWVRQRPRLSLVIAGGLGWFIARMRRPKHAILVLPDGEQRRVELGGTSMLDAVKVLAPVLEALLIQQLAAQPEPAPPEQPHNGAVVAAVERPS